MSETVRDGKYVELTYKVTDKKSGQVLTLVEFPLGYVHGHNEILAPFVHAQLEGKSAGDVIEVPIDGNRIFGAMNESLVFTDRVENVPEEYRQVGTSILMENDRGQTHSFLVTRVDDETLTVDALPIYLSSAMKMARSGFSGRPSSEQIVRTRHA